MSDKKVEGLGEIKEYRGAKSRVPGMFPRGKDVWFIFAKKEKSSIIVPDTVKDKTGMVDILIVGVGAEVPDIFVDDIVMVTPHMSGFAIPFKEDLEINIVPDRDVRGFITK